MAEEPNYHKCAIADCRAQISGTHLMCPPHWRRVPRYLQQIIWQNYRNRTMGQEYYSAVEQAKQIVASFAGEAPGKSAPGGPARVSWSRLAGLQPGMFRTRPRRSA